MEHKKVNELANLLKVAFFVGNKIIQVDQTNEYTKLGPDSSLYIDLNTIKGANTLKLLMDSDKLHLQNNLYKIVSTEFMIDGSALFINLLNM